MAIEIELHPVQTKILRLLLFKTKARFAELNTSCLTNDHFTFHLNRLVEIGLVEKKDKKYRLTTKGKEFANRLDTSRLVVERQAKLGVLIACVKGKGKTEKYLVQQRLKQPYYGYYGFMTGKISWGETVLETATRELKEETNLKAKLTLVGIHHKMDYAKEGNLLEDKYFYVFRGENVSGKLKEKFEGGRNLWLTEKEIGKLPKLFNDLDEIIQMVNQNKTLFLETKYTASGY